MSNCKVCRSASVAVIALVLAAPAYAQQAGTPDANAAPAATQASPNTAPVPPVSTPEEVSGPGDIVVTAQRRVQRLQDVPVSVSVVSGTQLAKANLTTLDAISARLPDVKITPGPLVDQINIRGVGSGQNVGFEQSVGTFVDGVYRARSRSSRAALFDIDRVEVLKGPQTTFFGANTVAGAINITTRKPGDTFAYNASGLYAFEDGEFNLEGGVDLPASDNLAFRVAGRVSGMDGYVKDTTTGDHGPHDRSELGRISARWKPLDNLTTDARFDIGHSNTKNAYPFELEHCPPPAGVVTQPGAACDRYRAANGGVVDNKVNGRSASPYSFSRFDFYEGALTNSLDVGPGSITSITSYYHHKFRNLLQSIPFPIAGTVNNYQGLPIYTGENYHQVSQELRYQSRTGGTFEYMFGGYYSSSHLSTFNVVGFYFLPFGAFNPTGTTNASTPVTGRPRLTVDDRVLSGFASATIRPVEHLRINLGARYTNVRKDADRDVTFGSAQNAVPSTYVPFDPITQIVFSQILGADLGQFAKPRRTDDKFMPSAGLQYDLNQNVMAYFSYSKGFKAGGYSGASLANSFDPETVNAYELGLKGQFFDRTVTTNIAVFRSDYSNLQEATVVAAGSGTIVSLVQNAAESRAQGVEFSGSWRATRHLTFSTDFAYLSSKYTSYPGAACTVIQQAQSATCSQDLSGKRRPYAPAWSGNVAADLTIPVAADRYQLHINPVGYFTTKFFELPTADPLIRQKGNVKFDLRVGFGPSDDRWEIAVVGKNLTNVWTAGYRQPVTYSNGSVYAYPDRPRAIAIQLSIKG